MSKKIICSPIPCVGCGHNIHYGLIFEIIPGAREDGIYLCSSCYHSAVPLQAESIEGKKQFDKIEV